MGAGEDRGPQWGIHDRAHPPKHPFPPRETDLCVLEISCNYRGTPGHHLEVSLSMDL